MPLSIDGSGKINGVDQGLNVVGVLTASSIDSTINGNVTGNVTGSITVGTGATVHGEENTVILSTHNDERLRIVSSGNICIGSTQPRAKLDVRQSSNDASTAFFYNGGGGAPSTVHIWEDNSSSDHYGLFVGGEDHTNPVLITKSNAVGIGTSAPTRKFQTYDDSNSIISVRAGNDGSNSNYAQIEWKIGDEPSSWIWKSSPLSTGYAGGNSWVFYNAHNTSTSFYTNNERRLDIRGDGDVVINGTDTSRAKLDLRANPDHPAFNITYPDGSFWRDLGTVGPNDSDGNYPSGAGYLHVRLRTIWNDSSMTMFRVTGYYAYSHYTESYVGMYRYGSSSYRYTPYGLNINNQGRATVHSVYNTNADPGYLVIVLNAGTYVGYRIEHCGSGGEYASYMQHDLEIIDTKRTSSTSAQW